MCVERAFAMVAVSAQRRIFSISVAQAWQSCIKLGFIRPAKSAVQSSTITLRLFQQTESGKRRGNKRTNKQTTIQLRWRKQAQVNSLHSITLLGAVGESQRLNINQLGSTKRAKQLKLPWKKTWRWESSINANFGLFSSSSQAYFMCRISQLELELDFEFEFEFELKVDKVKQSEVNEAWANESATFAPSLKLVPNCNLNPKQVSSYSATCSWDLLFIVSLIVDYNWMMNEEWWSTFRSSLELELQLKL